MIAKLLHIYEKKSIVNTKINYTIRILDIIIWVDS